MRLKYDPVYYVWKEGSAYHKLRLLLLLGRKRGKSMEPLIRQLQALQNRDGGWPWQWDSDKPSGVGESARAVKVLLRAGEARTSESLEACLSFLLSRQKQDGGWPENRELEGTIPPDWGWVSTEYSCTYKTAEVMGAILAAGYCDDPRLGDALSFLYKTQNEEGGWPSHVGPDYPYGTDIAAMDHIVEALLRLGEPKDSPLLKRAVEALLKNRRNWKEPVDASSALTVFTALGYDLEKEWVKELIQTILESQRSDGGWSWLRDLASNPDQTLECLEVLTACGLPVTELSDPRESEACGMAIP